MFASALSLVRARSALICILVMGLWHSAQAGTSTVAAESLLAAPDDAGWNLEAMMAARHTTGSNTAAETKSPPAAGNNSSNKRTIPLMAAHTESEAGTMAVSLRRQLKALRTQLNKEKDAENELRSNLSQMASDLAAAKKNVTPVVSVPPPQAYELAQLKTVLAEVREQNNVLTNQVDSLKAGLADREAKLAIMSGPQDKLQNALTEKQTALERAGRELADLKATLAEKTEALNAVKKQSGEGNAAVETLQASLTAKEKAVSDLNAALSARSDELKKAAATLADLRSKQTGEEDNLAPSSDEQRQAYMAGVMMADGLEKRLDGWKQAGVNTDMKMFRAGLTDGLQGHIRLKQGVARKAQAAFVDAVQNGALHKVTDAQKQLAALAKGRKPLKSVAGISWYRIRKGRLIPKGMPVTLSMTEQVANGKVISRVPAIAVRPSDDVPSIVKDGMYLPGEGGEVVAYALARSVYGELPLPEGVQPFTVMEYHLTGATGGHR